MRLSEAGKADGSVRQVYADIDNSGMVPFTGQEVRMYWADGDAPHSLQVPIKFLKAIVELSR